MIKMEMQSKLIVKEKHQLLIRNNILIMSLSLEKHKQHLLILKVIFQVMIKGKKISMLGMILRCLSQLRKDWALIHFTVLVIITMVINQVL